jgi:hypothetical protein
MHRKLVVVVVGLFAALIVPAAIASQPTIQRIPFEDHLVTQSCGFPVQIDATGTVVDISSTDAQGNFHEFQAGPTAKATLTNLVNGKTIVVNNSGPGDSTFGADGSFTRVGTGLALVSAESRHARAGNFSQPGKVRRVPLGLGCPVTITLTGTTIDLCAQLA